MRNNISETSKGTFGSFLAGYILEHDGTIRKASEKIGLHPYIISKHIRMMNRPTYASIMLYSNYLMIRPGKIADMIDTDWSDHGGKEI